MAKYKALTAFATKGLKGENVIGLLKRRDLSGILNTGLENDGSN